MDPQSQFCHNPACPDRGRGGRGNIRIHSQKEQRYRCSTCGQSFAATKGTPFYRLRGETDVVTRVLTLLCHGCPLPAIVAAFGFDERTVARWRARAGHHCQQVHEQLVSQGVWSWVMCKRTNCGSSGWADGCGGRWPWRCRHAYGWVG